MFTEKVMMETLKHAWIIAPQDKGCSQEGNLARVEKLRVQPCAFI